MGKEETVVITNMCKVTDGQGNVLVQFRTDAGWPGAVFPGGHVEKGESFVGSVIREVREETGLTVHSPVLCGVKQFETEDHKRYIVLLFKAERFSGTLRSSPEGEARWVKESEVGSLPMPPGFSDMIRIFDDESISELFYPAGKDSPEYY